MLVNCKYIFFIECPISLPNVTLHKLTGGDLDFMSGVLRDAACVGYYSIYVQKYVYN